MDSLTVRSRFITCSTLTGSSGFLHLFHVLFTLILAFLLTVNVNGEFCLPVSLSLANVCSSFCPHSSAQFWSESVSWRQVTATSLNVWIRWRPAEVPCWPSSDAHPPWGQLWFACPNEQKVTISQIDPEQRQTCFYLSCMQHRKVTSNTKLEQDVWMQESVTVTCNIASWSLGHGHSRHPTSTVNMHGRHWQGEWNQSLSNIYKYSIYMQINPISHQTILN